MARLMIVCPETGIEVFTGVEIASDTFAQIPDIVARMLCPACKQEHAWRKRDAKLDDTASAPRRPSADSSPEAR